MIDVGVDVGGTFTDFTFFDRDSGELWVKKVPSTPSDVAAAVLTGLDDIDLADVGNIIHGTTVALNSVIQRAGANMALITTRGFRDHIEIGDTLRYTGGLYDHRWVRTPPYPVPHERRFELDERTDGDGDVVRPVREAEVAALAEELRPLDLEAVAICFLNSYVNPTQRKPRRRMAGGASSGLRHLGVLGESRVPRVSALHHGGVQRLRHPDDRRLCRPSRNRRSPSAAISATCST